MSQVLITAQTTAATSVKFYVKSDNHKTISALGLTGAEYIDILVEHGNTLIPSGVENRLTATSPSKIISGTGNYAVQKPVTTNPVSVAFAV